MTDGIVAMRQQRPDDFRVAPMLGIRRQPERGRVRGCVGPAEIAMRPHVIHPPGQPIAVSYDAIGLSNDKPIRANRDERAKFSNKPRFADAENWRRHKAARGISQGILNRWASANS